MIFNARFEFEKLIKYCKPGVHLTFRPSFAVQYFCFCSHLIYQLHKQQYYYSWKSESLCTEVFVLIFSSCVSFVGFNLINVWFLFPKKYCNHLHVSNVVIFTTSRLWKCNIIQNPKHYPKLFFCCFRHFWHVTHGHCNYLFK